MSLPSRLLGANPSIQVSTLLTGSLSTPSAKQAFLDEDYELISTSLVSSSTPSITFSSIPQTYKHLRFIGLLSTGAETDYYMSFNSDETNSNYRFTALNYNASTRVVTNGDTRFFAYDNTDNANAFCSIDSWIIDYTRTDWYKQVLSESGWFQSTPRATTYRNSLVWENNSAISSVKISPSSGNLKSGCRLSLYGLKG
jgi:hypothetical protein